MQETLAGVGGGVSLGKAAWLPGAAPLMDEQINLKFAEYKAALGAAGK